MTFDVVSRRRCSFVQLSSEGSNDFQLEATQKALLANEC